MDILKKHAILTAVAVLAGIAAVYWLKPATDGGTVFIMTVCLLVANAIGAMFALVWSMLTSERKAAVRKEVSDADPQR
jgi:hypothetical protein